MVIKYIDRYAYVHMKGTQQNSTFQQNAFTQIHIFVVFVGRRVQLWYKAIAFVRWCWRNNLCPIEKYLVVSGNQGVFSVAAKLVLNIQCKVHDCLIQNTTLSTHAVALGTRGVSDCSIDPVIHRDVVLYFHISWGILFYVRSNIVDPFFSNFTHICLDYSIITSNKQMV